ncbi:MAG: DUF305 domain-containing protein [Thermoleophilia bacterium]
MKSKANNNALLWWALLAGVIAVISLIAAQVVSETAGDCNNGSDGMGGMMDGSGGMMGGSGSMMGDIDRHFIEQMIPHHEDAVSMADLAPTRSEHPELRQLAETIKRDQTREIDQMKEWYLSWYGFDVPTDDSAFSGGGMMGGGMMGGGMMGGGMMSGGMMSETDLKVLESAPEFDKEFIEQMIPHHQMAVMMARMLLAGTDRPEMEDLARSIIETQTNEIEMMQDWYQVWYED